MTLRVEHAMTPPQFIMQEFAIFGQAENLAQKQAEASLAEKEQSGRLFGPAQTPQTLEV
jgi:hypothetical protein